MASYLDFEIERLQPAVAKITRAALKDPASFRPNRLIGMYQELVHLRAELGVMAGVYTEQQLREALPPDYRPPRGVIEIIPGRDPISNF